MKREIKFRAWQIHMNQMFHSIHANHGGEQLNAIFDDEKFIFMQYTGLKDKNGKEIYEDDIVEMEDSTNEEMYGGLIEIIKEVVVFEGGSFNPVSLIPSEEIEIIGNIHENPELL